MGSGYDQVWGPLVLSLTKLFLAVLVSTSFGLLLASGIQLLALDAFKALLIWVLGSLLFWAILRSSLPAMAKVQADQGWLVLLAAGLASAGNYAAFLLGVAWIPHHWVPSDALAWGGGSGATIGALAWASWAWVQLEQRQVLRQQQQSVAEAQRLLELEAPKDAEDKLRESLIRLEVAFGSRHLHCAQAALDLARFYQRLGSRSRAATMLRRALQLRQQLLGPNDLQACTLVLEWVEQDDLLQPQEAIGLLRGALLGLEKHLGAYAPLVALAYERLGDLQETSALAQAQVAFRRAYVILGRGQSQRRRDQFRIGLKLAESLRSQGRPQDALELLQELEPVSSLQPAAGLLRFLVLGVKAHIDLLDHNSASHQGWAALKLLQCELGPLLPELQAIWDSCLDQLTQPLPPATRELYRHLLNEEIKELPLPDVESLDQRDALGWTLLQWATFLGQERRLEQLLTLRGVLGGSAPPAEPLPSPHNHEARGVLGGGAKPPLDHEARGVLGGGATAPSGDEWPLLHIACRWSQRRLLSTFWHRLGSIHQLTPSGMSAAHRCAQNGDSRLLEILPGDLSLNLSNERGDTPLLIACRRGHYAFVVLLLQREADVNKVNPRSGRTPLHEAAYLGHRALAECLVLNGARIDLRDRIGLTAAELAAQAEHEGLARFLDTFAKGQK